MSKTRREAYKRLFPNSDPDAIGTHAPECHTYHPGCAFHAGYTAAEKTIAGWNRLRRAIQRSSRCQGHHHGVEIERKRIAEAVQGLPDAYGHGVAVLRHSVLAIIEGTTDE